MAGSIQARIALNRFGLGARAGEVALISPAPGAWLHAQMVRPGGAPAVPGVASAALRTQTAFSTAAPAQLAILQADLTARVTAQVASPWPFLERLAMFWSNHFAVSASRDVDRMLGVPFENEAIRPFVCTTFLQMLTASQRHQGMLYYLDLANSVGPDSPRGRRMGLSYNENYAREVMELHTVGAASGYTQADVDELALALTGWSVNITTGLAFYDPNGHEPGSRTVLGTLLPAASGTGPAQTDAALSFLANHPATAARVCAKLAAHFVADTPPAELVAAMTAAWGQDGQLQAVYTAMLSDPSAWQPTCAKYKSPELFVLSAARALGIAGEAPLLLQQMGALAQTPFEASSPQGYPDTTGDWLTPMAVLTRLDIASALAAMADVAQAPLALLADLLAPAAGSHTIDAIRQAASPADGYGLLLASPEFQTR